MTHQKKKKRLQMIQQLIFLMQQLIIELLRELANEPIARILRIDQSSFN